MGDFDGSYRHLMQAKMVMHSIGPKQRTASNYREHWRQPWSHRFSVSALSLLALFNSSNCLGISQARFHQLVAFYREELSILKGDEKYRFATLAFNSSQTPTASQDHLPASPIYPLFIDRDFLLKYRTSQKKKWKLWRHPIDESKLFDIQEIGYSQAMTRAFEYLSLQIGLPHTIDSMIDLHGRAIRGVRKNYPGTNPYNHDDYVFEVGLTRKVAFSPFAEVWNHYKTNNEALKELDSSRILYFPQFIESSLRAIYSIETTQTTDKPRSEVRGLNEFEEQIRKYIIEIKDEYSAVYSAGKIFSFFKTPERFRQKAQPFFDHYESQVNLVKTLEGKLMAIAELLRALRVMHAFSDGNQRTFSFLMLTKLLIENNLPPAILDDPYIFNGYLTVKATARQIQKGIENFFDETEAFQVKQCPLSPDTDRREFSYFSETDYEPYFEKHGKTHTLKPVQSISNYTARAL